MAPNPFLPGPPGKKGDTTMILFLMFSFLTVMTPMCVFYLSYHRYLDVWYQYTIGIPSDKNIAGVSGIASAIALQGVVAAFIFIAFREPDTPAVSAKKQGVKAE